MVSTAVRMTVLSFAVAIRVLLCRKSRCAVSTTVFIVGKNAATENTEIAMSSGDEAGRAGGVVSGTTGGSCRFRLGSAVVLIEGYATAFCGTRIEQNGDNTNAPHGIQVAPSQGKVFVVP